MLETVYFHHLVPAWSRNLTAKAVRRPKLHVTDSGLAAALCGVDADALRRPDATFSGAFLESFVVGEVARQLTWSETEASLFHWRDRDGAKVDIVLERPNGLVVGIEVKAAFDLSAGDSKGLAVVARSPWRRVRVASYSTAAIESNVSMSASSRCRSRRSGRHDVGMPIRPTGPDRPSSSTAPRQHRSPPRRAQPWRNLRHVESMPTRSRRRASNGSRHSAPSRRETCTTFAGNGRPAGERE